MKILVACEESQTVTKAFRKLGHQAYSCDILNCSGGHPEWHIQGNVKYLLDGSVFKDEWFDMIIAHPPCTYLCNSGVRWLYEDKTRWKKLEDATNFFKMIMNSNCEKIAIENPIPHKYAVERIGRKYDQIVQPWMFGHMERKATCFWLKGLPKLKETNNVKEEMLKLSKNQQQRLHYLSPSEDRAKLRSKTFEGIAQAIAEQWGD